MDALIPTGRHDLLDDVFELFRQEILATDPDYAASIGLSQLNLETFAPAYYAKRIDSDPFVWAAKNLEADYNRERRYTVPWRYAASPHVTVSRSAGRHWGSCSGAAARLLLRSKRPKRRSPARPQGYTPNRVQRFPAERTHRIPPDLRDPPDLSHAVDTLLPASCQRRDM
ncbi:MAG: hypothetical protein ACK4QP_15805 [Pseudorhizobium sp.]